MEVVMYQLYLSYIEARKHKRNTQNQLAFELNLEENLSLLLNIKMVHTKSSIMRMIKPFSDFLKTIDFYPTFISLG